MRLTDRQAKYVQNRLKGLGKSASAIAAGYSSNSPDVAAAKLENNPRVRKELDKANDRVFAKAEVTAEDIVKESWSIATDPSVPAAARVSALSLLAKRHREFSDKREVDVRAVSLIASTFGVDETELIEEANNIRALLKSGQDV